MIGIARTVMVLLALAASTEALADYVSADVLNCRSAPRAKAALVKRLRYGTRLSIADRQGEWYRVSAPHCWVLAQHVREGAPPANARASRGQASIRKPIPHPSDYFRPHRN